MATHRPGWGSMLFLVCIFLIVMPGKATAFGAGNIPSIATVEGKNWRHGDIEDMLKTLAFLGGKKWTSMLIKRTYFGNWLRDYSQAVDVGSLKGANAETIRILIWVLSFMAFGYATEEFEVTAERLEVYRPEQHIDNPLGYADGKDAREFDKRLRGPVDPQELEIDMRTGMKNYIANENGNWATSAGYLRFSFARSIHFGRTFKHGSGGSSGKDSDLSEALRCLGQALHCMEDFSAHSNYCELALRELGYDAFAHCGTATEINLRGKRVYPLVTGTFGGVDFLHSVIGEATDHFTQSEVEELDIALKNAEQAKRSGGGGGGDGSRGLFGSSSGSGSDFISLLSQLPGTGDGFASEARNLEAVSAAKEEQNARSRDRDRANVNVVPGMDPDFDPVDTVRKIYPILEFRDKVVRSISAVISKIPGLEKLLEHIGETLTAFVLGLLAPFIRPIIKQLSKTLKDGSSGIIGADAHSQLEPWKDPSCSNPTHSMLSKDHFTNILNACAGRVAVTVVQYTVPRIIYAWENPGVPVEEVVNDVIRAFHHPVMRDERVEVQRDMYKTVQMWANEYPRRHELNHLLNSESVKHGKNHIVSGQAKKSGGHAHSHGGGGGWMDTISGLGHGKVTGSLWSQAQTRDLSSLQGRDGKPEDNYLSTSPAPGYQPHQPPVSPGFGYNQSGPPPSGGYQQQQQQYPGQGGHGAAPPPSSYGQGYPPQGDSQGYYQQQQQQQQQQPPPGGYWQGGQPPPQQQWGGGPQQQYPPQQQQYPPQQYPPQQYPPQYPPQGQGPPYGQPPPGQGWGGGYSGGY